MDNEQSNVPTIIESVNAATDIPDRCNIFNIKGEGEDMRLDFKPASHEYADLDYTSEQPKMSVVKQENALDNDVDDPILCSGVKEENMDVEWRDIDAQRRLQATSTPAVTGSMNVDTCSVMQDDGLDIKEERADTDIDVRPIVLQHTDMRYRPKQQNTSAVKEENTIADDGNDATLCNRVKLKSVEDECSAETDTQHSNNVVQTGQQALSQLYSCDKCVKTFTRKKFLLQHSRNLHSTASHKCTKCNKKFPSNSYLRTHTINTHSKQQYECAVCKKTYKSKPSLNQHVYRVHRPRPADPEPRMHICDYCQKTFTIKGTLTFHIACVHSSRSYKCSECNKHFKCEQYLTTHMARFHYAGSLPRIYICAYCQKTFTLKGSLTLHVTRVHAGGSYKCSQCNRFFISKQHLMKHTTRTRHAGSEPRIYSCDYCQKTYTNKSTLTVHVTRVHASGSYKCSHCDSRFKCEQYLMTHMTRAHPAGSHQPHACSNCGKNYKTKRYCQRHEKRGTCTRDTARNKSAVASTSRQQHNVDLVKEEPADGELELGPTVFQHMDCNYRPYKLEPQLE